MEIPKDMRNVCVLAALLVGVETAEPWAWPDLDGHCSSGRVSHLVVHILLCIFRISGRVPDGISFVLW